MLQQLHQYILQKNTQLVNKYINCTVLSPYNVRNTFRCFCYFRHQRVKLIIIVCHITNLQVATNIPGCIELILLLLSIQVTEIRGVIEAVVLTSGVLKHTNQNEHYSRKDSKQSCDRALVLFDRPAYGDRGQLVVILYLLIHLHVCRLTVFLYSYHVMYIM